MFRKILFICSLSLVSTFFVGCAYFTGKNNFSERQEANNPPLAAKKSSQLSYHGKIYLDDYAWLRTKENPEVIDYLNQENEYTKKMTAGNLNFQQKLFQEMKDRIKENDSSAPVKRGDYYYFSRTESGKQYPIYVRKKGSLANQEEVILDLNQIASEHDYLSLGIFDISPDNRYLAYSLDTDGSEKYTLFFKDLKNNETLAEKIPETYYSSAWANDNRTFFYVVQDQASRPYKLFSHKIGTDSAKDKLIYHEEDESYYASVSRSHSGKYLMLNLGSQISSEVRFWSADKPNEPPSVFQARKRGVEYSVEQHEKDFYILTNENALNFKLLKTPVNNIGKENWQTVIPHSTHNKIEQVMAFKNYLAIVERENGLSKLLILNFLKNEPEYISLAEDVYSLSLGSNPAYETDTLRFNYESLTTPSSVYDYDMISGERLLIKREEVPGGYNAGNYSSERVFAKANDGTLIPVSLVYKKGLKKDGSNPLYLYGYGSYGATTDPDFSTSRLSLLDRGFVYAIAHIRGSGDLDRAWYENGKFLKKKNTFTDFINVAEHLIKEKYTSNDRLAISGGSAGGLLMGAVTNMRPDLFKVVIADVPFVDVINTMMDPSLPLTVIEYDEWGNPNEKEYFDYMLSYSPYDNVKKQNYPNMLVTAGLNDPRVGYWEPAKFVAKIRTQKTDKNILLLKTNMEAGHGGASGRYDYLKDISFEYSFIMSLLGINQ